MSTRTSHVLLAIVATILVFAALKATRPVSLPLFFGMVLLLFFRPLQRRLNRTLPNWASAVIIMLLTLAALALGVWALEYSISVVAPQLPSYAERLQGKLQSARDWLQGRGISLPSDASGFSGLAPGLLREARNLLDGLSLMVLTLTVLVFLLFEASGFRADAERALAEATGNRLIDAFDRMTGKFERYVWVQLFTSVLTGVLTWLWCLLLGVDFALIWGLFALVVEFVPIIGSFIAVVPVTLFALAFMSLGQTLLLLAGLVVIQLGIGNFVQPALEGKAVKLSALVVLLAVLFWGWLWGVGGAIIGVPLTIAVALICQEFDALRPIAIFLSEPGEA